MPRAVYVLAVGIFAMVTSEFAVSGLMPQMAGGLGVTISQIGYLITAFAVAMAAGGPLMTVALVRIRPKPALMLLFAHLSVPAVIAMLGVGLVGVTMNPAMAVRVQRVGTPGPLVNTVHASFITLGVIVGSSVGGLVIDGFGLRAPLWLGAGLAVLGVVSLLPELGRRTGARSSAPGLVDSCLASPAGQERP
ncbi:MFS transporter [Nonomuraea sp. NPDC048881]|uniref:MFS transporter n=1 Tax=Nonomuraea sp. NPDC048881 TaxID=3155030 RepID=UPI00340DC707